jgi:hypothetical protein
MFIGFNLLSQKSHHPVLPFSKTDPLDPRPSGDPIDGRSGALPAFG